MPIGKSKISDMDFGSFENTIDKNVETDKTSDKFDQQLQAYKDAGNSLTSAKSGLEIATASMHEAKDKLSEASDTLYSHFDCLFCRIMHRQVKKECHGIILKQCRDNLFLHACNCFLLLFGYKLLVTEKWKTDYHI